ncbi:putative syntaxin-8B [Vanrija pseudolonga]|uniref:Syntaxin-8B n=1 Tax=Vanrija pseudolonga TaxID=143232 RepID=A0AAF0YED4_9TREE|nr:putative syntaxin-8B [Vanrija pseudolonga]
MSNAGAIASISNRLTSAQSQLLERSRILGLGMKPSPSSTQSLVRTLTQVRNDLAKLEGEAELEAAGLAVGGGGKKRSNLSGGDLAAIDELGGRYDRLVEMLQADEVGREKAKPLVRERREAEPSAEELDAEIESVIAAPVDPPSPPAQELRPFRDYDDEEEDDTNPHEMISQQQQMMEEQDERLTLLSHSINRQNHLSVQIGDELQVHNELLEDTDAAMDRTADRMNRARRRLDHVADNAKQHGSTITIVGLIVVLLLLIIVFKT